VQGIVQGVGFRPFVYGLAAELELAGFVCNDSQGVVIEVEGAPWTLNSFQEALWCRQPPLAQIDSVITTFMSPYGEEAFTISSSQSAHQRHTLIAPDVATCSACLLELLDPTDRRYDYPFINCTNCGPRFTIVQDIPYDRDKTTMWGFQLCPACQAEYDDPLNRRFHAQPNACPVCGPQVQLSVVRNQDSVADHEIPIRETAELLAQGKVVAIKGLGGYHLACDALNETAVTVLRQRKQREAKPFALMVPDLETARQLCFIDEVEAELLQSRQRPIVLLKQRPHSPIAPAVAPCYNSLGIMLPYTPLHTLLLRDFANSVGSERPSVLVMTSGNISDEPIAYHDDEAQQRLAPIVDYFLTHNRDIHIRCDDSIVRVVKDETQMLRRSRGYVPAPIALQRPFPLPILAVGGHLKNSFCLGQENRAFVSHHIGDLENLETLTSFREGIDHFQRLFAIEPEAVAYDLHPEYLATKHALNLDLPHKIGVQHHHAHIASVMAEHDLTEQLIGVAADGTGYGLDGAIWGGEFMVADYRDFERVAHLAYVPLPGGEQAIKQPWRMAAVYLHYTFGDDFLNLDIPFVQQLDQQKWRPLAQMMERGLNSPVTSSFGRLFDAVSALLGIRGEAIYEGQAAIELEMLAQSTDKFYPFAITDETPALLDVRPAIEAVVDELKQGVPNPLIAGRFQRTVAEMITAVCRQIQHQTGLKRVALSGGVFQNRLLLEQTMPLLRNEGFQVYTNHQVPPNDGGISLGQAVIAGAKLRNDGL
jgi:hydrogenase maturation protein HypF